ncbi:ATPase [Paludicola sp. MB14-C6]|uniref:ATPase n=1 Tax=Paludihabitans sp. MB14-C6 TaxID=3070656 RepID=UPI0027DD3AC4|nr:ATPase [Paludicola sp. MB14-C6]WMJ23605.1 ATPase [Paludicola sp. MB14-C6]
MNINENLDLLDDILDSAWSVPLSGGRCMVDIDKVREIVDDIRLNLPSEIKQAKMIVSDRKVIIDDARKEADSIVRIAEERAKKLVETSEIVRQSQDRAKEIIAQTNNQNRELKKATNEFIENALKHSEDILGAALQEIKSTRQALKQPAKK